MALLQYDIRVVGAANVDKALAGIEARIRAHNARVTHLTGVTPTQARRAASPGGLQADTRRFQGAAAAQFKTTAREQAAGARAQAVADRIAARQKVAALREEHRIKNAMNNVALRQVKDEDRERSRALVRHQRMTERIARTRTSAVSNALGHGADRATRTIGAVGTAGAAMLGVGGAALAATAVGDATKLDETTRRLIIQGTPAGEQSKYDPEDLRKKFTQTGIETGIAPENVAEGVAQFVTKVGDLDTAVKNMKVFATVAQATGASVQDIASSAADLSQKMDIKSVEDMSQALATLTFQGKKGAFELKDMAAYLPEVLAGAQKFGIKGQAGITAVGGTLQIARQATGNGAEAATSVEAMFRQLVAKSADIQSGDAFSGRKVSVFEGNDPTKPMRDFREVLADMIAASRGNVQQLNETFDVRGVRAVNPLISAYRDASDKAGGGEKGVAAGRAAILAAMSDAADVQASYADVQKDAKDAMQSFNVQMEVINTELKREISTELLPELVKLAPQIAELVPYVGRAAKVFVELVSFLLAHPFRSIAMIIGAQLAADFAAAKLGSLVSGLITRALAGIGGNAKALPTGGLGGGGSAAPTGGGFLSNPGAGGMLNAAGTGAAVGLTIASAIFTVGVANVEIAEANMKKTADTLTAVREMNGPEDAKRARELIMQEQTSLSKVKDDRGVFDSIMGMFGASNTDVEIKTRESFIKEMEEKLQKLELLNDAATKMQAAGTSQEEAAKKLTEVAQKLGLQPLNRTNNPSPIKG